MLVQLAMTLSTVHGWSLPEQESSRKMDSPPKVYLHTFPPLPHVYSMSPFSLKVESWLRLHGIDYECVYCMEFGPKNQIPFVLWSVTR